MLVVAPVIVLLARASPPANFGLTRAATKGDARVSALDET